MDLDRGVVAVTGEDRLQPWLHLLLTQHVADLPAGRATEALILSWRTATSSTRCISSTTAPRPGPRRTRHQDALLAYLELMKFFYRVETADRTDDFAVVHLPAGRSPGPQAWRTPDAVRA